MLFWRLCIAVCLLIFASLPIAAGQTEWTTATLMEKLAAVREAELTFVEHRTSSFLLDKIKLTGRMNYRAPDFIQKLIDSPFTERIQIEGDRITIEKVSGRGESTIQQYSVSSSDSLKNAIDGIRATLAGNLNELTENFNVEMTGEISDWSVRLVPKSEKALEQIEKIEISGSDRLIKLIETFNTDGDETSLALSYLMIK